MSLIRRSHDVDNAEIQANGATALPTGRRRRGSGLLWLAAFMAGACLAAVVAVLIVRGGILGGQKSTVTSATLKASLKDSAELATQEYNFTDIGKHSENAEILGLDVPLTGSSFLVTYSGTVKAGIKDMSAMDIDVNNSTRTITITAPAVEVLSSSIDPETVDVIDESHNPINQTEVSDVTKVLAGQEDVEEKKAVEAGLLTKAESRAETLLASQTKATLKGSDQEDYTVKVTFKDASGK